MPLPLLQSDGTVVACAICGSRETRHLYEKSGYGIGACARCGLVYANPRAPEAKILARYSRDYFWNEYLPSLGAAKGKYDLAQFDLRHAALLRMMAERAPGKRLLEVGCGAGFFLKAAERAGWQVEGIELSDEASRFAGERLQLPIRRERAEDGADRRRFVRRGGDVRRDRAPLRSSLGPDGASRARSCRAV